MAPRTVQIQVSRVEEDEYLLVFLGQLCMTTITYSNFLSNTKVRERHRLGGALLIENLTAVPTVVLTVGEGERSTTPQTYVGVNPFWGCLGVDHRRACDCRVSRREVEP